MRLLTIFTLMLMMGGLSACAESKREELKSPCVGKEGSPCGPRRSINSWWQA